MTTACLAWWRGLRLEQMLAGMARLTEMVADGEPALDNVYPQAVKPEGNRVAQEIIAKVFEPAAANWRALGVIPGSGLAIRGAVSRSSMRCERFELVARDAPEPAGCRCGEVITGPLHAGRLRAVRQALHADVAGRAVHGQQRGNCAAWFKYGRRRRGRSTKVESRKAEIRRRCA